MNLHRLSRVMTAFALLASFAGVASQPTTPAGPTMSNNVSSKLQPSCQSDIATECKVVELRQYTLYPGKRDTLIALFDKEFVESQEALGMTLFGQFRNLDNPDTFVWLRGFSDMPARNQALTAFYGGPVWLQHRSEANATMVDSDNVLLLRPAWPGSGLRFERDKRAQRDAVEIPPGLVDITVFHLREPADAALLEFCSGKMTSVLSRGGALDIAWYITEDAPNDFTKLPVRTGEHVLVGVASFRDSSQYDEFLESGAWNREVAPMLKPYLDGPTQSMRLTPTARSALHQ